MKLWARLHQRGWFTSTTSSPRGLHLMLSPFHLQVIDTYLADLKWALEEVQAEGVDAQPSPEARYS
jgi:hypothetical protein